MAARGNQSGCEQLASQLASYDADHQFDDRHDAADISACLLRHGCKCGYFSSIRRTCFSICLASSSPVAPKYGVLHRCMCDIGYNWSIVGIDLADAANVKLLTPCELKRRGVRFKQSILGVRLPLGPDMAMQTCVHVHCLRRVRLK